MSFPASSTAAPVEKRDYTVNRRLLMLSAIALGIGALSTVAASVLVNLIRFFTNLFFYQTLSLAEKGLVRRKRLDRNGRDETRYLRPLQEIVARGITPAEELLEKFHGAWNGSVAPIYQEEAY